MSLRFFATASLSAFKAKASLFSLSPLLASSKAPNKPGFLLSPCKLLAKSFNLPIAAVLASISLRLASIAGKTLSLIPSDNALISLV